MGTERRSMFISDKEKKITAYHEAGHALVAKMVGDGVDPVHKVTIIPRGPALGLTQQLPTEDRYSYSKEFALAQISICMGGRIAEEITFGQKTTGAGNDIEKATDLARKMVCEWGMSDKLGPLAFGKKEHEPFLGREVQGTPDYSGQTAIEIDAEVRSIVTTQYERAKKILMENLEKLKAVAEALLEYETIDGEDIDVVLGGGTIQRRPPPVSRPPAVEAVKEKRPSIFARPTPVLKEEPEKA